MREQNVEAERALYDAFVAGDDRPTEFWGFPGEVAFGEFWR